MQNITSISFVPTIGYLSQSFCLVAGLKTVHDYCTAPCPSIVL